MAEATLSSSQYRAAPRCRYQAQDSQQTLEQALGEYYALNRGRVSLPEQLPPESAALFRRHDICHVIFGLDTTLADEAMADTRTLLSCDVGWRRYAKYLASDVTAKAAFKQAGYLTVLWATIRTIPRLARALFESWRMRKRWPWNPPPEFYARRLSDLRHEFGIRVI